MAFAPPAVPVPPVDSDVRDVLSGLSGPEEVEKVKRLRDWAHNVRLIYEALLDEGFTADQAVVVLQQVSAIQQVPVDKKEPEKTPGLFPYTGPLPMIPMPPDTVPNLNITSQTITTAASNARVQRVLTALSPPF